MDFARAAMLYLHGGLVEVVAGFLDFSSLKRGLVWLSFVRFAGGGEHVF